MPTSVKKNRYVTQEVIMHVFLDAISAADLTPVTSFAFFICFISASVQSLRAFMNLNREQLALAATFWWPTFAKGTVVAAENSITSKSLSVSKSLVGFTFLSSLELLELLPMLRGMKGSVKVNGASSSSHEYDASDSYARKASMMVSCELCAQSSSYGCVLLEMPTTTEMFSAGTLRKPPKFPCPRRVSWFVSVTLLSHAQVLPKLRYIIYVCILSSASFLAEVSVRSPRKLFIFII